MQVPQDADAPEILEKEVGVSPEEQPINDDPEAGKADPLLDEPYLTNPFFYEVADYFSLEPKDYAEAVEKVGTIVDWVVEEYGVKSSEDILLKLREVEHSLTPPEWGQRRYTNFFKYVRLGLKDQSIRKAMKAFRKVEDGESN